MSLLDTSGHNQAALESTAHHCTPSGIFSAVADTCCYLGDATGGMAEAALASASLPDTNEAVVIEPPGSSPQSPSTSSDPPIDALHGGALGLQLMMVSSAYALMGHYDEELFDLIGRQVGGSPARLDSSKGKFLESRYGEIPRV